MVKNSRAKNKRTAKSRPHSGGGIFIRVCIIIVLGGILAGSIYLLQNPEVLTGLSPKKSVPFTKTDEPSSPLSPPAIEEKTVSISLYFSDPHSDFLVSEPRTVMWNAGDVKDQIRVVMEELIKGPKGDLLQTIPSQVVIRDIKLENDGLAILNFSRELSRNHPGGSLAEMQTIYSIVNSLVLSISSLKQVQILVEGKSPDTLKGHIDCRAPFEANLSIIKTG
ncbi:MAG: GerMN domain-containing protein [Pseudomonadota bacterium]